MAWNKRDQSQEWTDVDDKLPMPHQKLAVKFVASHVNRDMRSLMGIAKMGSDKEFKIISSDAEDDEECLVTHWIYLP